MKYRRAKSQLIEQPKARPIKTTVMDLLEQLTSLTKDDAVVLALMKSIFACYRVRLAGSLAPVRLVNDDFSARAARRSNLGRRSSTWA